MTIPDFLHLLASVEPTQKGCLEWPFGRSDLNYGICKIDGVSVKVHILSYRLYYGILPVGFCVCHSCDNPPCFNPLHLFHGTRKQNSEDMVIKGRSNRGEKHGKAILTESAVRDILSLRDQLTMNQLAAQFGVSRHTIKDVLYRQTWRHVIA